MLSISRSAQVLRNRTCQAFVSSMAASLAGNNSAGPVDACLAVSRQGVVCLDPSQSSPILEQPPGAHSRLRTLVLNKQSTLNALNREMLETLHARVSLLDEADTVDAILLTATPGRAFSAGGDIRALYDAGENQDFQKIEDYFRTEYRLDWLLGNLKNTHLISVLNGIVMGGGAGISMHGRFRIATENTLFAMPECSIGLYPDVGMSYLLSRLSGGIGVYLALTGSRLKGVDVYTAGLATHYVPSHMLPDLVARLGSINVASPGLISRAITDFSIPSESKNLAHHHIVEECFVDADGSFENLSIAAILERLRKVSDRSRPDSSDRKFAESATEMIRKGCPVGVKICLESMKRARHMSSLSECLQMDFRLAVRCSRLPNFFAGVKSAIVTKDRNPVWQPADIESVPDEDVLSFFKPLSADFNIPELDFDGLDTRSRL